MTYTFLIPAAIAQIYNPIVELVIPIGIPKEEIKIHEVIIKQEYVQYNLKLYKPSCALYSSIHFALFLQGNSFLFHPYFFI